MNTRQMLKAAVLVAGAVLLQTTLFRTVRPFDVAPDLVLLAVIACGFYLEAERGVLMGFTAGLLIDLAGTSPLGLQAMAFTLVAFTAVRLAHRVQYGIGYQLVAVGGLSLLGVILVALVGTLFGEGTLGSTDIIGTLLLVAVYNMMLGIAVLPLASRMLRRPVRGSLII